MESRINARFVRLFCSVSVMVSRPARCFSAGDMILLPVPIFIAVQVNRILNLEILFTC